MNYYELMVIFSPNLTEEEVKTQSTQVEELIVSLKGNIHLVDNWGKRKLAYPIKKQRQGYYVWYYFELNPSNVAEVDRKLKMSETILRFMIVKMEKIQIANLEKEKERHRRLAEAPVPEQMSETTAEMEEGVGETVVGTEEETTGTTGAEG